MKKIFRVASRWFVLVFLLLLVGVLSAAASEASSFACSDKRLNELHEACCRLAQDNLRHIREGGSLIGLPGCGSDAVACAAAFANNFDMREFYTKVVREYLSATTNADWCVKTAPSEVWPVAVPAILDVLYRYYGARDVVDEAYPALVRYARFVVARHPDGAVTKGIGDRLSTGKVSDDINVQLMWLNYLNHLVRFCGWLGRADDEREWQATVEKMRAAFRRRHMMHLTWTRGMIGDGYQSAQAAGIVLGVVEPKWRAEAFMRLQHSVSQTGLKSGEQMTGMVLEELSRHWNFGTAEKAVNGIKTKRDTYVIGFIDAWLFGYVLGARVADDAVGGNRVILRSPDPQFGLTHAKGALRTAAGLVNVAWGIDANAKLVSTHTATDGIQLRNEPDERHVNPDIFGKPAEEKFAPHIHLVFPTGREPGGGYRQNLTLRWTDPSVIPEIPVYKLEEGRMEVVRGTPTFVRFYHDGQLEPVREYELVTGKTVFKVLYRYEGKLRNETRYVFEPEDTMTVEQRGPDGTLLARALLVKRAVGNKRYLREEDGDVVTEIQHEVYKDIGLRTVYASKGTGANRVWEQNRFYTSGVGCGSKSSELHSNGEWTMYEYYPIAEKWTDGKLSYHHESAVTTPIDGAKAVTNAEGRVVSFVGKAKRVEYGYIPVDPQDDGRCNDWEPRQTVVWEVSDDGSRKEISREYYAVRPAEGAKGVVVVRETTTRAGAPYGDPGNKRKETFLDGEKERDTIPHREEETFQGEGGTWCASARYEGTPSAPNGTPYETVIHRTITNPRRQVMREEDWIMLPEGGRELLTWKNYTRDADGNEIAVETSSGDLSTKKWDDGSLVFSRDAQGLERNYRYDAIGRQIHTDGNVYEHNQAYDLGSYVTNVWGSVFGRRYGYAVKHDDAGRLVDVSGEPGEKWETKTDSDGVTRTRVNGQLVRSEVTKDGVTTVYEGSKGLDSPRWRAYSYNDDEGYSVVTMPRIGGGVLSVTNRYDREEKKEREKWETKSRYEKIRGCWWKTERTETVCGTNRMFRGGRRLRVTGRRRDGADERVRVDEKGHETRSLTFRDALSKVSTEIVTHPTATQPEICVTSNGVTVLTVSPSGVTNVFTRGFQGRLVAETDGRGGSVRYDYDANGRLRARTDRCGRTWSHAEDRRGRRVATICPSGLRVRHEYDAFGRETGVVAGKTRVENVYDDYGDLVKTETLVDGKVTDTVEYRHDEATGLLVCRIHNGRATELAYSADNELKAIGGVDVKAYFIARTNGLAIAQDDFGRAVGYSVRGVAKTRQAYDPKTGRLESVEVMGLGTVRLAYLAGTDLVETMTYPKGVTAKFEYDAEDRPVRVVWRGLGAEARTIEAKPTKEWEPPAFDDEPELRDPPIASDPQVYVATGGFLARPLAVRDKDGRLAWCLLDASRDAVSGERFGGKEAK